MKITFECEKCGYQESPGPDILKANGSGGIAISEIRRVYGDRPCPKCAEPTYGPLTVEMVAEALWECICSGETPWRDVHPSIQEELRSEARFVLRLLEEWGKHGDGGALRHAFYARDWLLKLARRK